MLRFKVRMTFAPQALGEAVAGLRCLLGPARAEPGCRAARLFRDASDESVVAYVEEWRNAEEFARHLRDVSSQRLVAVMELAAVEPTFEVDEVTSRPGFDVVLNLVGPPMLSGWEAGEPEPRRAVAAREQARRDAEKAAAGEAPDAVAIGSI